MIALVGFTVGFQPLMMPASLSKMKMALPERSCDFTENFPVPLNTRPVGADCAPDPEGILTTNGTMLPVPVYNVESPVPLSATQAGLPPLKSKPQAFTRFGSVVLAKPGMSETRFFCSYFCAVASPPSAATANTATAQRPT